MNEEVDQFKTSSGATWWYGQGVAGDAQFKSRPGYRKLKNPATGTALVTFRCPCVTYPETVDVLDSHQGRYYFFLEMHFVTGTADPRKMAQNILRYAGLVKARIAGRAPLPTPPPTATPSPPPSALNLAPRLTSLECTYDGAPRAIGVGIHDTAHGVAVCIQTRDPDGGSNFSGYLNTAGRRPPAGKMYLYVWATEHVLALQMHYLSAIGNFEVRGRDGQVFLPQVGTPFGDGADAFNPVSLESFDALNVGYVLFEVPEHDGPYTVLWNEAGAIPFTPVTDLPVFPSH